MSKNPKATLALGLLMAAPHEINNVVAVLQSLAGAMQDGRTIPDSWGAEFWNAQASKLKKASDDVARARQTLRESGLA